jgi:hypothetical protein
MNRQGQIPRSRGGISGLLLVLLGLWGGLAPFVGPYFVFGFTPDKAWAYTSGRLYYSAVPGAAAVLGGLMVLLTRSRGVGIAGGLLAALGGAWFSLGQGFVTVVLKKTTISIGSPITSSGTSIGLVHTRQYLESVGLFGGLGVLIVFFGALAIGRFSMVAAKDVAAADGSGYYADVPASQAVSQPGVNLYPGAGQYQTSADQFPADQYSQSSPFPDSPSQFPASPSPFPDTTTAEFPPSEGGSS